MRNINNIIILVTMFAYFLLPSCKEDVNKAPHQTYKVELIDSLGVELFISNILNIDSDTFCGYTDVFYLKSDNYTFPVKIFAECYHYKGGLREIPRRYLYKEKPENWVHLNQEYLFHGVSKYRIDEVYKIVDEVSDYNNTISLGYDSKYNKLKPFSLEYASGRNDSTLLIIIYLTRRYYDDLDKLRPPQP